MTIKINEDQIHILKKVLAKEKVKLLSVEINSTTREELLELEEIENILQESY